MHLEWPNLHTITRPQDHHRRRRWISPFTHGKIVGVHGIPWVDVGQTPTGHPWKHFRDRNLGYLNQFQHERCNLVSGLGRFNPR